MNLRSELKDAETICDPLKVDDRKSFYKIYKSLIQDPVFRKNLSDSAILLYSLMLDRRRMSIGNGWVDRKGETFIIYTVSDIQKDLNCSKDKVIRLLGELENEDGPVFISRKRVNKNLPSIIHVRPLEEVISGYENPTSDQVLKTDSGYENPTSGGLKNQPLEVLKTESNKNNRKKNKRNKKSVVKSEEERYQEVSSYLEKIWSSYDPFLDPLLSREEGLLREYMLEFKENRNAEEIREVFFDLSFLAKDYMRIAEVDRSSKRAEESFQILQEVYERFFFDTITIRKLKELNSDEVSKVYLLIADYLSGEKEEEIKDIRSYCAGILKNKIA